MGKRTSRRRMMQTSLALGAGFWLGTQARGESDSPNEKLNIGIIGAGGKGESNLMGVLRENVVAIADVDEERASKGVRMAPKANFYRDFRKMLDQEKLDAVMVSTPDHTHAVAAVAAMQRGLHVYCEKPLAHSVAECRRMRDVARDKKVMTQMGNQGHSSPAMWEAVELVQRGDLGQVTEFHAWTNRPSWPQGIERPSEVVPVPATLDWDLWLGPAPERPYHPAYAPFRWRGWWDFGTGSLGDMACHIADLGFTALKLEYPTRIEADTTECFPDSPPRSATVRFDFPARGELVPVRFTWYDGGRKPDPALVGLSELPGNGSILVGDKATLYIPDEYGRVTQLLPKDSKEPRPAPPEPPNQMSIIRVALNHYKEWLDACKGGRTPRSNFDSASLLTEVILLGNVATRLGEPIEWDAEGMRVTNHSDAETLIRPTYRKGWELG